MPETDDEFVEPALGVREGYPESEDGRPSRRTTRSDVIDMIIRTRLLKVYASCVDGQEIIADRSIDQALGTVGKEAAILDPIGGAVGSLGDLPAGGASDGHAEQARNDEIDDHGAPS